VLAHRRRAGHRPRLPPPEETDDFTTGNLQFEKPGNGRACTASCEAMTLSTELRACARDGIEPPDLHLSEVTELFTTGIDGRRLGNGGIGFSGANAGLFR